MKPIFLQPGGIYKLKTVLDFGKHKGKMLEEVIREDPSYVKWAISNIRGFQMDTPANKLYDINSVKLKRYSIAELQHLFK